MCYYVILLVLFFSSLCAMESKQNQLEFSNRKTYIDAQKKSTSVEIVVPKPCVFCDSDILATNYIVNENKEDDVRVIMNKFPYFHPSQGVHFLIMPISHKEQLSELCDIGLVRQMNKVQELSVLLYDDAYTQEFFINWGKLSGQSQPHLHSHLKSYVKPPMSVPQAIKCSKNAEITTVQQSFEAIKKILESKNNISVLSSLLLNYHFIESNTSQCNCCLVQRDQTSDEDNLVVARFKYNYVCLSHYPRLPGEVSIVPNDHVFSIKDLSQKVLCENMMLAMMLLPKLKAYAQEHIRECDGGNIFIKSMGNKISDKDKNSYHLHTLVMPRTIIAATPGTMDGNSCKLDYDPVHFFQYLKETLLKV